MNIKFGMDNFYVKYLKRFLNHELEQSTNILGKFNKNDLTDLVKYLNLPNVKHMFEVEQEIKQKFPELEEYFNIRLKDNVIIYTSKVISENIANFLIDNIDNIKEYCLSVGWLVSNISEWIDLSKDINNDGIIDNKDREIIYDIVYSTHNYDSTIIKKADINLDGVVDSTDISLIDEYLNTGKLTLEIKQSDRTNYFPNKDMLVFVNQFDGTFIYDYAIRDGIGVDDVPHYNTSGKYKIALYKCTPGQKITLAHNCSSKVDLIIGCSPAYLKQDLTGFTLQNVQEVSLEPGKSYEYTCTSEANSTGYNANWLCIQCPSNHRDIFGSNTKSMILEVGDVNFDGQINMQDYQLLARYTATGPGSEELKWEPSAKQKAVMDINGNGKIDNEDATILYNFIQGNTTYPSLGLTLYTYNAPNENEGDLNVSNFLIIDGHYDHSVNIPFEDFIQDDWVIHEKFFNYLLGMAVHIYSPSENITYLQELLKEYYPAHTYNKDFFYPGVYSDEMKILVKNYQTDHVYYTTGDLNKDNRIDKTDLQILRNYLDELKNEEETQSLIRQETEEPSELNALQKQRMDINHDNIIDEKDYLLLQEQVEGRTNELDKYEVTFMLGWYDVQTEALMENEINVSENISEVSK